MDDEKCLFSSIETKVSSPIIFDAFSYKENQNELIIGKIGIGSSYVSKKRIIELAKIQHIVNNHLNQNNWLKLHGKPMIRKGHPFYNECKRLKGVKPFIIVVVDPKQEYENMAKIMSSEVLKFQKGDS